MLNITEEQFQSEVLESNQVTLVDFWAPWCGQCKQLNPILEQLEKEILNNEELKDKVKFTKIDIDSSGSVASTYYVSLLPTILIFTNTGKLAKRLSGLSTKAFLLKSINETLNNQIDELY